MPDDPMLNKVILALVGALIAWGLKSIWDEYTTRRRWRRLTPLVLRQLSAACRSCEAAFDQVGLPRVTSKLLAAQASAIEMVAVGVCASQWLTGLQYIADSLDAVQEVEGAPLTAKVAALDTLRCTGRNLSAWAKATEADLFRATKRAGDLPNVIQ